MMPNLSAACGHCLRAERYKASTPLRAAPPGASVAFECGCSVHGWFTILQQLFVYKDQIPRVMARALNGSRRSESEGPRRHERLSEPQAGSAVFTANKV